MPSSHRPRKRFGQNFLRDRSVVEKILLAAEPGPETRVLEIGPGQGALTGHLLARSREVTVMEVDRDLAAALRGRTEANLRVIEGDCLELDWPGLLPAPPIRWWRTCPTISPARSCSRFWTTGDSSRAWC